MNRMSMGETVSGSISLVLNVRDYFDTMIGDALKHHHIKSEALTQKYLSDILMFYMNTEHLFDESSEGGQKTRSTLAEMYLKAMQTNNKQSRLEIYKKLGDTSLYISGFFSESFAKKLYDVDYYVDMGGSAYESLASIVEDSAYQQMYKDISRNFVSYMDVYSYISSKAGLNQQSNLLAQYEKFLQTGSKQAQENLLSQGIIPVHGPIKKAN